MLEISGVCKCYGQHEVLRDVSLTIGQEIRVIIGLNGSGKSTLLKIIAGILAADAGQVVLNGRDVSALPPEERRVGYVPQHPALFSHLIVRENVRYGLRGGRGSDELVQKVVKMLDLEDVLERKPEELSGGYKSRTSLARALAPQPQVMLLDEPLSDIDVAIKEKLLPEFREVLKFLKVPVLYVTHDPWEAEQIGDSFSVMVDGCIRDIASAEEAFAFIRKNRIEVA
ncbi:MAG: Fe(3+)-transporting ATPase [Clostridia bacterium 62_21]|nr:MAG: Fe(3+)-transporting ATPase [Clostridia bacterium 62_21]HAG07016.1 ABC transporter ATP-binding protein [Peptococcaceae bacterium]